MTSTKKQARPRPGSSSGSGFAGYAFKRRHWPMGSVCSLHVSLSLSAFARLTTCHLRRRSGRRADLLAKLGRTKRALSIRRVAAVGTQVGGGTDQTSRARWRSSASRRSVTRRTRIVCVCEGGEEWVGAMKCVTALIRLCPFTSRPKRCWQSDFSYAHPNPLSAPAVRSLPALRPWRTA